MSRATLLLFFSVLAFSLTGPDAPARDLKPVYIGLDAEFGRPTSTADDAIKQGITIAIEEINAAGGVTVGKEKWPFKLEVMDTRDCDAGVPVSEALLVVEKVILDKNADFIIGPSRSEAAAPSRPSRRSSPRR